MLLCMLYRYIGHYLLDEKKGIKSVSYTLDFTVPHCLLKIPLPVGYITDTH